MSRYTHLRSIHLNVKQSLLSHKVQMRKRKAFINRHYIGLNSPTLQGRCNENLVRLRN